MKTLAMTITIGILLLCFCLANASAQTLIDREAYQAYAADVPAIRDLPLNADELCLAYNVYHEARDQPYEGRLAVAHVAMNRARATGDDICTTVWKHRAFSWTLDHDSKFIKERRAWFDAKGIALKVYNGNSIDVTAHATHYHRYDVSPKWAAAGIGKKRIGAHVFMRLRGEF